MSAALDFTGGASPSGAQAGVVGSGGVFYGVQGRLGTKLMCLAVDPVASEYS